MLPNFVSQPGNTMINSLGANILPNPASLPRVEEDGILYIGNLSAEVTDQILVEHFARFGNVSISPLGYTSRIYRKFIC
jgi:RNA recognition motif-containing protein